MCYIPWGEEGLCGCSGPWQSARISGYFTFSDRRLEGLVWSALDYFEAMLDVRPVQGNLVVSVPSCGTAQVPIVHQTVGTANTDYVVYVTARYWGRTWVLDIGVGPR